MNAGASTGFEVIARRGMFTAAGWVIRDPVNKRQLCNLKGHPIVFQREDLADAFLEGYTFGVDIGRREDNE